MHGQPAAFLAYSRAAAEALQKRTFYCEAIASKGLAYESLINC